MRTFARRFPGNGSLPHKGRGSALSADPLTEGPGTCPCPHAYYIIAVLLDSSIAFCPRRESNPDLPLGMQALYPLSYGGIDESIARSRSRAERKAIP